MDNMNQITKDAVKQMRRNLNWLFDDEKVDIDVNKKSYMLDAWQDVMRKSIEKCRSNYNKCIFHTWYDSFSDKHLKALTLDECFEFVQMLCVRLEQSISEE